MGDGEDAGRRSGRSERSGRSRRSGRAHRPDGAGGRGTSGGPSDRSEPGPPRPGRLVVGVSGSLAGLAALRAAAREARTGGRALVAVLAWEPPEGEAAYMLRPDREWAAYWREDARARLGRAFDEAFGGDPPGVVAVERRLVRDRAWRALCGAADRPDDRLVIGARGARWGRRYGATARRVLARAACPVLVVPAPHLPRHDRAALRRATPEDFFLSPA
ncbi:universal stress protein [Streptomyces albus subsp. chlorinus]|uniref:universal stress protein n=1 Tax=Streptomyces albus TaxID=1888 RepID=UPI0015700C65|nr:universal stress protein [Streptomyces albus]NSC21792.1 universal stress protein [Streptomyces albus subsp. chlorinus]